MTEEYVDDGRKLKDITIKELREIAKDGITILSAPPDLSSQIKHSLWESAARYIGLIAVLGFLLLPSCYKQYETNAANKARVAKISINGVIGRKGGYDRSITDADKIIGYFKQAQQEGMEAYWMVINSPGGEVYPSKEIADKVLEVRAGKDGMLKTPDDIPVVMQIKDRGASGAYMIAVSGEKIFADEASEVGSIGVIMRSLEYGDLLQKLGVKPVTIFRGKYKDAMNPYRSMNEEERKKIEGLIDVMYRMFVSHVAKNRQLDYKDAEKLADGWICFGNEAKEKKLIDEVGTEKDVENYLKKRLGRDGIIVQEYKDQPGLFDGLLAQMKGF